MRKTIISVILLLLAAAILAGCAPATGFIEETTEKPSGIVAPPDSGNSTEFSNFAIHSNSYFFSKGEYFYFFSYFLAEYMSSHTEQELAEIGLDLSGNTSLKEQYYKQEGDTKITWYEAFRDVTVKYMEKILLVCEVAQLEESKHVYDSEKYRNERTTLLKSEAKNAGKSVEEYVYEKYNGNVSFAELQSVWQKEYIYNAYTEAKLKTLKSAITAAEAEIYFNSLVEAAGDDLTKVPEKDTTLSRNIICVIFGQNKEDADGMLADFVSGEMTADSLEALVEDSNYITEAVKNCTKSGVDDVIRGWLFADERELGDAAILEINTLGHCLFFWESEGEAQYIITARKNLADKQLQDWFAELKEGIAIVTDQEVLDGLNA